MENILVKLNQQWAGIIGTFIAIIALVVSIYSLRRGTEMRNQQEQERLFEEIKNLLDVESTKSKRFIEQLMKKALITTGRIDNEGRIIRETNRYFGRTCHRKLQKIIELHKEAQKYNYELSKLFNALLKGEPDTHARLTKALEADRRGEIILLDEPNMNEVIEKASVTFFNNESNENSTYDFREIYGRYLKISKKIDERTRKLESCLKKKMMER